MEKIYCDINGSHQNSICAINENGQIIFAVEKERLTRIRFYNDLIIEKTNNSIMIKHNPDFSLLLSSIFNYLKDKDIILKDFLDKFPEIIKIDEHYFPVPDHHLGHAASAFYPSGFSKSAILTADAVGYPEETTVSWIGNNNKIKKIDSISLPHSLGRFYALVGAHLGLLPNSEGKVMGLSSYGKDSKFVNIFKKVILLEKNGRFSFNSEFIKTPKNGVNGEIYQPYFSKKLIELIGSRREKEEPIIEKHYNIAYAAQKVFEECLIHITKYLHKKTKLDNLCLAGGVFLNCVANRKILDHSGFKNIFIQPAANDSGLSIGYCLYWYHNFKKDNIYPNYLSFMTRFINYFKNNEKYSEILNSAKKIIDTIKLDNFNSLRTAADIYYELAEYKRALDYLDKALNTSVFSEFDKYDTILKKAYCEYELKNIQKASEYFDIYINYDPTNQDVRKIYCYCLIELKKFDKAQMELKPYFNKIDFANVIGSLYFYKNKLSKAMDFFEISAFELKDKESYRNCFNCSKSLNNKEKEKYYNDKLKELSNEK